MHELCIECFLFVSSNNTTKDAVWSCGCGVNQHCIGCSIAHTVSLTAFINRLKTLLRDADS